MDFLWNFVTTKIKPKLSKTNAIVVDLIDRIRLLDNDIIRLQQKLDTVIELREKETYEEKPKAKKR